MKFAITADGQRIEAKADAEERAVCPDCGGIVILRRKRLMNGRGDSYFWRHPDNQKLRCRKRPAPWR